jgi:hypothetical protein
MYVHQGTFEESATMTGGISIVIDVFSGNFLVGVILKV